MKLRWVATKATPTKKRAAEEEAGANGRTKEIEGEDGRRGNKGDRELLREAVARQKGKRGARVKESEEQAEEEYERK